MLNLCAQREWGYHWACQVAGQPDRGYVADSDAARGPVNISRRAYKRERYDTDFHLFLRIRISLPPSRDVSQTLRPMCNPLLQWTPRRPFPSSRRVRLSPRPY